MWNVFCELKYWFNPLNPGRCGSIFQMYFLNSFYEILSWITPMKLVFGECHRTPLMTVNNGSSDGLVPSGNKPEPEPMLAQICVTTWFHNAIEYYFSSTTLHLFLYNIM